MSKIALKPNANGTGVFSLEAPDSNTDRTLTLPDEVGKFLTDSGALNVDPSAPTQSAAIDSSGNLLVGTSAVAPVTASNVEGISLQTTGGNLQVNRSDNIAAYFGRKGSDGDIVQFRKDGSAGGAIGVATDSSTFQPYFVNFDNFGIRLANLALVSTNESGTYQDNVHNVGASDVRWQDIYATNGTIQTSDVNEKQDVAELSDAEARVAAKSKTLLRKYRWKSAVEEKGDEARIHFGIIAQDLEQAFIDEGLDAGRYGMFIRGEWYEAEVEKTRTVKNDDGTETTETYMATETYDSAEEAPADAVHKERLGVRYHELLAFIIAAI